MNPMDSKAGSVVAVVAILIAFAWIGCAYIMGAETETEAETETKRMILHPIVPILLILLLLNFRKDDSIRYVVNIAIAFISVWLFVRLQSVFMPFIMGFSLAYIVYVALAGLQNIPIPLPKRKRFYLPKGAAIAVLVILMVGFIVFLAVGIVPQLVQQATGMQKGIGNVYTRIRDSLSEVEKGEYPLKDRLPRSWRPIIDKAMVRLLFSIEPTYQSALDNAYLFRTGLESQSDLDIGSIPEGLRQEFEDNGVSLSENATVTIEKEGSRWLVTDEDNGDNEEESIEQADSLWYYDQADSLWYYVQKEYIVEKEEDKLNIYSNISEELLQEFENNGILLSGGVTASIEEEDSRWLITDSEKRYIVRKENDELNIYTVKISSYVQERIPELGSRALKILTGLLSRLREGIGKTMGQISSAFFVFIVFVYAVQSFHSHMERLNKLVPEAQRDRIARYLGEIDRNMRSFLRGQLTVIVIISIISIIAYSIIRIPLALLVGLLAGLCNAIPTIGPIIGGGIAILASVMGFVASTYGLTGFLIRLGLVLIVTFAIQLLDNSLISPKIMSTAIEVHPLVIIFAVLLSASLVGIWGAVLAIPGIVVVKGVLKASNEMRAERAADEMGIEPGQ